MFDVLSDYYLWIKAMHIMSVIAWMAGLFYLPRLFVYHAEESTLGKQLDSTLKTMEKKLLRVIMNPAMISTWLFGVLLVLTPGVIDWGAVWPWTKLTSILGMTWFHHWLAKRRKDFEFGENTLSGRTYRMMNEVPTVLMLVIVVSVVAKPF